MDTVESEPIQLRPGDKEVWDEVQYTTRNAVEVQRKLLRSILERNAGTEYLQRHGLDGRTDAQSFKACIPLTTHADYEEYLQRIADGDTSPILCADRISAMYLSSGTSGGKLKMIPQTTEVAGVPFKMFRRCDLFRNMAFPLNPGAKTLAFNYASKASTTKGGLPLGSAAAVFYRSAAYENRPKNVVFPFPTAISPIEVIRAGRTREAMYCHLLCGLKLYRKVDAIVSIFVYRVSEAFRFLEQVWQELADDLRTGTVSVERVSEEEVRVAVEKLLEGPDPDAAARVEKECGCGDWQGIAKRLWPSATYIQAIITGSMKPYVPVVQRYAGPALPLVSAHYGASEGWIGSNFNPRNAPDDTVFTLASDVVYLEFIPLHKRTESYVGVEDEIHVASTDSHAEGEPVGFGDLQVGQDYEPVFTTFTGLYRYRLGDVLKVVGFYHQSPVVKFMYRKNVLLSVNTDKTDEAELMAVVSKAAKHLEAEHLEVVDFTSHADTTSRPGCYVIYWELNKSENLPVDTLQTCCTVMDQSFGSFYRVGRVAKTHGPLKLRVVQGGTFEQILEYVKGLGGGDGSYKTPRCVTSAKLLNILNGRILEELQSPDFPEQLLAVGNSASHNA